MAKYMKIDPTFKAKWLAALRSGEYEQARETLMRIDGDRAAYCCIGVGACVKHGLPPGSIVPEYIVLEYIVPEYIEGKGSTRNASEFIGVVGAAQSALVTLNDDKKQDFNHIADWIEQNL